MWDNYDDQRIIELVKQSKTLADVLRGLGLEKWSGNYRNLHAKIKELNIDISHMDPGSANTKRHHSYCQYSLKDILVQNSKYLNTSRLKQKLIQAGLLKEQCCVCGLGPQWNGERLSLQLDHINGVHNDNRLSNLRIICPNCHTQTETFSNKRNKLPDKLCPDCGDIIQRKSDRCTKCSVAYSRKIKTSTVAAKREKRIWKCVDCNSDISRRARRCKKCSNNLNSKKEQSVKKLNKIVWPDNETLRKMVFDIPAERVGLKLGVSGKAVEKHCKKLGIQKPGRGYWAKRAAGKI